MGLGNASIIKHFLKHVLFFVNGSSYFVGRNCSDFHSRVVYTVLEYYVILCRTQ